MEELFLHRLAEKHLSDIKRKIGVFRRNFEMLHELLSYDDYYKEREELEYFSNLYLELAPILTEITCYAGSNGYLRKKKKVDRIVFNSQKVLYYLKVLHTRYLSLNGLPYTECSENMENYEIMKEMKFILENISTKASMTIKASVFHEAFLFKINLRSMIIILTVPTYLHV